MVCVLFSVFWEEFFYVLNTSEKVLLCVALGLAFGRLRICETSRAGAVAGRCKIRVHLHQAQPFQTSLPANPLCGRRIMSVIAVRRLAVISTVHAPARHARQRQTGVNRRAPAVLHQLIPDEAQRRLPAMERSERNSADKRNTQVVLTSRFWRHLRGGCPCPRLSETVITRHFPAVVFQSCSALDADVQNRTQRASLCRCGAKPIVFVLLHASLVGRF